jgi:hypothetical protein
MAGSGEETSFNKIFTPDSEIEVDFRSKLDRFSARDDESGCSPGITATYTPTMPPQSVRHAVSEAR